MGTSFCLHSPPIRSLRAVTGNFARAGRVFVAVRFKGTDSTFSSFPKRLGHVLSKSIDNVVTECVVFPEYEVSLLTSFDTEVNGLALGLQTKGDLVSDF